MAYTDEQVAASTEAKRMGVAPSTAGKMGKGVVYIWDALACMDKQEQDLIKRIGLGEFIKRMAQAAGSLPGNNKLDWL